MKDIKKITNMHHVYCTMISLMNNNEMWHMDDDVEDCFGDLPKSDQERLIKAQSEMWEVCIENEIDIHAVSIDVINSFARAGYTGPPKEL